VIAMASGLGVATECAPAAESTPGAVGTLAPGTIFQDCADGCPEMVVIGPGRFEMGAAEGEDEREQTRDFERARTAPRHSVVIGYKFALGKYDVTRAEFSAFARETGYQVHGACAGYRAAVGLPVTWRDPGYPQTDRDPVVCVSWNDAQAYLAWLSQKTHQRYRLPSEAEWEYAARAGTATTRYWGDGTVEACRYANVADLTHLGQWKFQPKPNRSFDCSDGYVHTSPVGSFLPNAFGLYDMLGNVHQLTEDCWNESYVGAPSDGSPWLYDTFFSRDCIAVRVMRGRDVATLPTGVRAAYRRDRYDASPSDSAGFRVARDL